MEMAKKVIFTYLLSIGGIENMKIKIAIQRW